MKPVSILQRKSSIWIALLILLLIVIISLGLINKLTTIERNRDIQNWQHRLSLMADVREDLLNDWLKTQFGTLSSLAKNQSLQLYLSQISQQADSSQTDVEAAQRTYLRNLLINTARSNGFYEESPISPIKANIPVIKHSGIAILSSTGEVIIATPGMPLLDIAAIERAGQVARSGVMGIRDIYLNKHAEPVMAFLVPVPALANTGTAERTSSVIVGLRTVRNSLYPLLDKEIFSTSTDVTVLVRREQGSAVYLNKLSPNNREMFLRLPQAPESLAAAYALTNPGAFGIRKNFLGKEVLFISRPIASTDWLLLQMVSRDEALKESDAHQKSLVTSFTLGLAALVFIIVASWRHGASLYAEQHAAELEAQSTLLAEQRNLLQSITDNIGDLIILTDGNMHIQFANSPTASLYQLEPPDLVGKSLTAALGSETGKILEEQSLNVRNTGQVIVAVNEFTFNDAVHTCHSSFLPVGQENILIVLHDITSLKDAQKKHDRLMKNLVQTLTHVIDSYDPNCANHSAKTVKVASAVGKEMNLSETDMETLELAASLANIGKLFVPREILTKTSKLTDEERKILQTSSSQTVNVLVGLEFDGPVLETIAQKNEHMDGSGGPGGLSGDRILMTARILAVANAFVAMHSPRAYREPLSTDDVLHRIYEDSDKLYDKHVVAALMHVVENKLDWI
jgi:HD-GYP domain-containing protein (c-di-GMP phosphodiesterase class II)